MFGGEAIYLVFKKYVLVPESFVRPGVQSDTWWFSQFLLEQQLEIGKIIGGVSGVKKEFSGAYLIFLVLL